MRRPQAEHVAESVGRLVALVATVELREGEVEEHVDAGLVTAAHCQRPFVVVDRQLVLPDLGQLVTVEGEGELVHHDELAALAAATLCLLEVAHRTSVVPVLQASEAAAEQPAVAVGGVGGVDGQARHLDGVFEAVQGREHFTLSTQGRIVARLDLQAGVEGAEGILKALHGLERHATVVLRVALLAPHLDGRLEVGQGLREAVHLHVHRASVVVVGVQQLWPRNAELLEVRLGHQVVARQRAAGVAGQKSFVGGFDARFAHAEERLKAIVARRLVARVGRDGLVEDLERFVRLGEVEKANRLDILDVSATSHLRLEGLDLADGLLVAALEQVRAEDAQPIIRLRVHGRALDFPLTLPRIPSAS
mmetsp:Transcript_16090/g.61369  ORF Transcript_16090/g.61369 Transcript_16090/m.61369 type:complete len:364 (-) Transcript_16090:131-1222(-)